MNKIVFTTKLLVLHRRQNYISLLKVLTKENEGEKQNWIKVFTFSSKHDNKYSINNKPKVS